jgi:hypothetical protein
LLRAAAPAVLRAAAHPRQLGRGLRSEAADRSPRALLALAPPPVAARAGGVVRALTPSPPPKRHLMWRASGALVHLYVAPSAALARSLHEREAVRAQCRVAGVPALLEHVRVDDAAWVVEEAVPGRAPDPGAASEWFPRVAEWLVGFGGPAGPPLGETEPWRTFRDAMLASLPGEAVALRALLPAVEALPARHQHGDLQPRNVLLDGAAVGVVDLEGVWRHGVPGHDLVFLALFARGRGPDAAVLDALLAGRDPDVGPVLEPLDRLGVPSAARPALLRVLLAMWAHAERRRHGRSEPVFATLLARAIGSPAGASVGAPGASDPR